MLWLVAVAGCCADSPPPKPPAASTAQAPPPAASTAQTLPPVTMKFDKTPWQKALDTVAQPLGLKVRLEFEPPGSVTYADNRARTPAEALDILHGVLLDRGVALVKRGDQLIACRLADETHFSHAPFVPAEQIRKGTDSLMVFTTITLNSLLAQDAKSELTGVLSPRGKIVNLAVANRIGVWDRSDNVRGLLKLLDLIDPIGRSAAAPLKTYPFQYGNASAAANVAREILGLEVEENDGWANSIGGLATQTFTKRNAGRMGRMFAPGMMGFMGGGGEGGEGTEKDSKVRISVDRERNTLYLHGPFEKLAYLDPLLKALDAPSPNLRPDVQMDLRVFAVVAGNGEAIAKNLKAACAGISGMTVAGARDKVIVQGPKDRLAEVAALFEKLNPASMQYAAFPTGDASAKAVAKQLAKLFESDAESTRPLLATSGADDQIVVRGTAAQVARVGGMMRSYAPLTIETSGRKSAAAPQSAPTPKP